MSEEESKKNDKVIEESEPYLGYSWAFAMLLLYALKEIFPADPYTKLWWFQMYILAIIFGVTVFTLIKRFKHFRRDEPEVNEDH